MMSTPSPSSIMRVTSKHFIDSLETNIVQIARALSLELEIKVDPDAKKMTRELVQGKINQLLSDTERIEIRKLWEDTVKSLRVSTGDSIQYVRKVYEALKTVGFDNV